MRVSAKQCGQLLARMHVRGDIEEATDENGPRKEGVVSAETRANRVVHGFCVLNMAKPSVLNELAFRPSIQFNF